MIVVADTSVLCYLVLIEQVELLSHLFGQIAIPQAVFEELRIDFRTSSKKLTLLFI